MFDKYDLKQLMKEIQEDEKVGNGKAKIASQDEIKKMFLAGKKKRESIHD